MSCYRLWQAWRLPGGQLVFGGPRQGAGTPVLLPCGRCFGCRMDSRREWAMRSMHEASLWESNLFLTLTYDEEHLPHCGTLVPEDLQRFLKRLRKAHSGVGVSPKGDRPIRYFACGEYGSQTRRPHYHLLLFNCALRDRVPYGRDTSTSQSISDLWSVGSHLVGEVTPASAAYVAGYSSKKVKSHADRLSQYETIVDEATGEVLWEHAPEFTRMSRRPGVGQWWFDKFKSDLHNGYIVQDGTKQPVPRYYLDKYRQEFSTRSDEHDLTRFKAMVRHRADRTVERLKARETVARAKFRHGKSLNQEV